MRTIITVKSLSCVRISYDADICSIESDTTRITREFSSPAHGGYVIERLPNGKFTYVCRALAHHGWALYCGNTPLINIIRCEYYAMRRQESCSASKQAGQPAAAISIDEYEETRL